MVRMRVNVVNPSVSMVQFDDFDREPVPQHTSYDALDVTLLPRVNETVEYEFHTFDDEFYIVHGVVTALVWSPGFSTVTVDVTVSMEQDSFRALSVEYRHSGCPADEYLRLVEQDSAAAAHFRKYQGKDVTDPLYFESAEAQFGEYVCFESSIVRSAVFNSRTERLDLELQNDHIYSYSRVNKTTFRALVSAPSTGTFYQSNVRNGFACVRVA